MSARNPSGTFSLMNGLCIKILLRFFTNRLIVTGVKPLLVLFENESANTLTASGGFSSCVISPIPRYVTNSLVSPGAKLCLSQTTQTALSVIFSP